MLCPGDARLVARDGALEGAAILLDDEAFVALLRRISGYSRIDRARARYARYKPGTSCLVAFDVFIDGSCAPVPAYARTHVRQAADKIAKVRERPEVAGPLGAGIFTLDDPAIAVFVFPNDHELRTLRRLADPRRRRRLLAAAVPGLDPDLDTDLVPLRYKPERRFVARATYPDGCALHLKLHADSDAGLPAPPLRDASFSSEGLLRVPRVLGITPERGLVVTEWIEDRPFASCANAANEALAMSRRVGAALAILHAQRPDLPRAYGPEQLSATLAASVSALAEIHEGSAPHAGRIATRLAERISQSPRDEVALHGDFSPDQVLLTDDTVSFVDFDRAGLGLRGLDLGSFLARLEFLVLTGELSRDLADACAAGIVGGYEETAAPSSIRSSVSVMTTFSLVRLAVEPFRSRRHDWPQLLDAILNRAEELSVAP